MTFLLPNVGKFHFVTKTWINEVNSCKFSLQQTKKREIRLIAALVVFIQAKFHRLLLKVTTPHVALTGVAQLVGHPPANQNVADSIPSQDACLGFGFIPQLGATN